MTESVVDPLERGLALKRAGDFYGAEAYFRALLALKPDDDGAAYNLSLLRLASGDYEEGFALFERRLPLRKARGLPGFQAPFPKWSGEPLAGKSLLIVHEQGFGDQIQFARYIPRLLREGVRVTALVIPPLARLMTTLGASVVILDGREVKMPRHDAWCYFGSLPFLLRERLETVSGDAYIFAPDAEPRPHHVGIVWQGSRAHPNDQHRSINPAILKPLLQTGSTFVALDPAITKATDLWDTAHRIAALDLVVTVDTAVAHLAGAMGKPTWVLLPREGLDWRWLRERNDSPWYNTVRLFRQDDRGWPEVIARVAEALSRGR